MGYGREKEVWTGEVNDTYWGAGNAEEFTLFVTLDKDPTRKVQIRVSDDTQRWMVAHFADARGWKIIRPGED